MAKRFIETGIFRKPFVRGLDAPCKLLFIYYLTECDHAGIWDLTNLDIDSILLGATITRDMVEHAFDGRGHIMDGKLFLPAFIYFQYGYELNAKNKVHQSVISRLKKTGFYKFLTTTTGKNKPLARGLEGATEGAPGGAKDKDKDKDTVHENGSDVVEPASQPIALYDSLEVTPQSQREVMKRLMALVNTLRPEWQKPATWDDNQKRKLMEGVAQQLNELDEQDWQNLRRYMVARLPKGYWQPVNRMKFLESFTDVFSGCQRWLKREGRQQTATPVQGQPQGFNAEEAAKAAEELKAIMAQKGGEA